MHSFVGSWIEIDDRESENVREGKRKMGKNLFLWKCLYLHICICKHICMQFGVGMRIIVRICVRTQLHLDLHILRHMYQY